jgi:glycosyltransferase involved in cell wall biosynthesis
MPYLPETIDSVVEQTFSDWELVIVDNASDDGTVEYIESRMATDSRIRLLRNEINLGVTKGLKRGLVHCRGRWIARIDADDRALPKRIGRQVAFMVANPDVVAVSCFAHYIGPRGNRLGVMPHDLTTRDDYRRYMAENGLIGILHPGAFIDAAALRAIGDYRPDYELAEDIDLWNRLSERGAVLVMPEFLMEYRLHGGSLLAGSSRRAYMTRQWVQASMLARRRGEPEPTKDEFEAEWRSAPLLTRLSRNRQLMAELLTRRGRENVAAGSRVTGIVKLAIATLLRPAYTWPRLKKHKQARDMAAALSAPAP